MLGPSGTGKSVFLKALIGLVKPDEGSIVIEGTDIASCSEKELYEVRKLFGELFQDGAMFGSGLDQVRTSFINQLFVDLNAQIDATFLIVTHDVHSVRVVPDQIGLLYHKHLAMYDPREMLLTSDEPVVRQFPNAQTIGPIACRPRCPTRR